MKSKGIGDTIEKITTATGIKAAVEYLEEKLDFDCGCEERKERLNKLFPYKTECLIEEEFIYLDNFNFGTETLTPDEQRNLLKIYNRVFSQNREMTSCRACWAEIVNKLRTVYGEYKNN